MIIQLLYSLPNCTLRLEGTQDNTSARRFWTSLFDGEVA